MTKGDFGPLAATVVGGRASSLFAFAARGPTRLCRDRQNRRPGRRTSRPRRIRDRPPVIPMRGIGAARSSIRIPALVLSGLSAPHAAAEALPAIEPLTNCYLEVPAELGLENGADCGYAVVPQARGESGDTGRIRLAFMRLNADVETDAAPLVMLAGGPGRALTGDPAVLQLIQSAFLGPLLETRDVVLMEQRGTLRARPHLGCPGFWSAWRDMVERALDEDAGRALLRERVGACVALHAAAGVDLAAWTNIENAADVNDLRAALDTSGSSFTVRPMAPNWVST